MQPLPFSSRNTKLKKARVIRIKKVDEHDDSFVDKVVFRV